VLLLLLLLLLVVACAAIITAAVITFAAGLVVVVLLLLPQDWTPEELNTLKQVVKEVEHQKGRVLWGAVRAAVCAPHCT
jgi:hypothetical protein